MDNLSTGREENVNPAAHLYRVDITRSRAGAGGDRVVQARCRQPSRGAVRGSEVGRGSRVRRPGQCGRRPQRPARMRRQLRVQGDLQLHRRRALRRAGHRADGRRPSRAPALAVRHEQVRVRAVPRHFRPDLPACATRLLRYANIYGPRQDFVAEEGRVVAIFASRMLEGKPVTIDGDGNQSRDMLHVGDVAMANLAALERGDGGTFHVSSGIPVTINDLFRKIALADRLQARAVVRSARARATSIASHSTTSARRSSSAGSRGSSSRKDCASPSTTSATRSPDSTPEVVDSRSPSCTATAPACSWHSPCCSACGARTRTSATSASAAAFGRPT